jgi:hypothetical protein
MKYRFTQSKEVETEIELTLPYYVKIGENRYAALLSPEQFVSVVSIGDYHSIAIGKPMKMDLRDFDTGVEIGSIQFNHALMLASSAINTPLTEQILEELPY